MPNIGYLQPSLAKPMKLYIPEWMTLTTAPPTGGGTVAQAEATAQASYCDLIFDNPSNDYGAQSLTPGMLTANPSLGIFDYLTAGFMGPTYQGPVTGTHPLSSYQIAAGSPAAISSIVVASNVATITVTHGLPIDGSQSVNASAVPVQVNITGTGTWDGPATVTSTVDATHLTCTGTAITAGGAGSGSAGSLTVYPFIFGSGNPIMDIDRQEWRDSALSAQTASGIGADYHLSQYSDYMGSLCDTMGRSPADGAYAQPQPRDPRTGAAYNFDRWMARSRDWLARFGSRLARNATASSVAYDPTELLSGNPATPIAITSITRSGSTATVLTAAAHPLLASHAGNVMVTIGGASVAAYNGTWLLTGSADSTHFTFTVSGTPANATGGNLTHALAHGATPTTGNRYPLYANGLEHGAGYWGVDKYTAVSLTGASTVSGSKVTFALTAHGFGVGDWVIVIGHNGANTNGLWPVTAVTANTFTCETYGSPAAGTTSGTAQRAGANRLILDAVHGAMGESTMRFATTTITGFPTTGSSFGSWIQNANMALDTQLRGRLFLWCTKIWPSASHSHVAISTTLSSALTSGNTYTTLSVAAVSGLPGALPSGATLVLREAGTGARHAQLVTLTSPANSGDTTLNVASFQANFSYATTAYVLYRNQDGLMDSYEAAQMDEWHQLCLASFLLTQIGLSYFHFRHDAPTKERYVVAHRYYTAVRNQLGTPANPIATDFPTSPAPDGKSGGVSNLASGSVYARRYTLGIVVVNPTSSAATYVFPAGHWNSISPIDGTSFLSDGSTAQSIPANTGLVLIGPT